MAPEVSWREISKKKLFESQELYGSAVDLDRKNFFLLETQKLYGSAYGL